jgi:hypothetical protein
MIDREMKRRGLIDFAFSAVIEQDMKDRVEVFGKVSPQWLYARAPKTRVIALIGDIEISYIGIAAELDDAAYQPRHSITGRWDFLEEEDSKIIYDGVDSIIKPMLTDLMTGLKSCLRDRNTKVNRWSQWK